MSSREMQPLGLIAAVSRNRVIGKDGALPWHVPEDLRHFRRVTEGHAIIMGRRTHESIGRPLPRRRNLVISRQQGRVIEGCEVVPSLEEAIGRARAGGDPMPMVIGGESVYRLALPLATHLYLTEIDREVEGDTCFPEVDETAFREVERTPGDTPGVSFVVLVRDRAAC